MQKVLAVGILAAASAGCGGEARSEPGPDVQRSYQVGNFERIEVAGPYQVEVRTGAQPSVTAQGSERSLERLVVEVRGDRLTIRPRERSGFRFPWSSRNSSRANLVVTVPMLRGAAIAGSGDIRINQIRADRFSGEVAGSGDIEIGGMDVQELKIEIAGSGEVRAGNGRARNLKVEIAGSGDVDVRGIQSETSAIEIAGSGNVAAHTTRTARVEIAGSGNVDMTGGAQCTVSKHGSGSVNCS